MCFLVAASNDGCSPSSGLTNCSRACLYLSTDRRENAVPHCCILSSPNRRANLRSSYSVTAVAYLLYRGRCLAPDVYVTIWHKVQIPSPCCLLPIGTNTRIATHYNFLGLCPNAHVSNLVLCYEHCPLKDYSWVQLKYKQCWEACDPED
jgi:hypothetical protein